MAYYSQLFKLSVAEEGQLNPSDLVLEAGEAAFSGTDLTVEVSTRLTQCLFASITPVDATYATNTSADQVYCDREITSGAITVGRGASGTSGMKFSYMFVGYRMPSVS